MGDGDEDADHDAGLFCSWCGVRNSARLALDRLEVDDTEAADDAALAPPVEDGVAPACC